MIRLLRRLIEHPFADLEVTRRIVAVTVPGWPHSPALGMLFRAAAQFAWPG